MFDDVIFNVAKVLELGTARAEDRRLMQDDHFVAVRQQLLQQSHDLQKMNDNVEASNRDNIRSLTEELYEASLVQAATDQGQRLPRSDKQQI